MTNEYKIASPSGEMRKLNNELARLVRDAMMEQEMYEPFYQWLKQPSTSVEWKELRELVDSLMEKTKHYTVDHILEIIDRTIRAASIYGGINGNLTVLGTLIEVKDKVLALKGGEQ